MDLSIVVVNWNSGEFLKRCLDSVYKNNQDLDFEVFVVDNASSDKSLRCLKEFSKIKLIRNETNAGFAKANNQAIKLSKGKHILLLNPDTLILKNNFKKSVSFLDANKDVGVLGCKLVNPDDSIQPSCHAFLSLVHVFFEVSQLNLLFPKNKFFIHLFRPLNKLKLFVNYSTPDEPIEVDSVMGSYYMIKREALEKTGLLDENFFLYHEEMELSYRMWQNDYKVMFYPYALVIHHGKHSVKKVKDLVYYERCRSILHFFRKHKHNQIVPLKIVMPFSLLINSFSLPFRKNFKEALGYRLKALKLLS